MAWWDGKSCASDDCIAASYYNGILDKGSEAWECIYGSPAGDPFPSIPRVDTDTPLCAADINVVRGHINTMIGEDCDECDWSNLGDPCEDSVNVSPGDDCCYCDYYCLDVALDCIIENCCGPKKKCVAEFRATWNCETGEWGDDDPVLHSYDCVDEDEETGSWELVSGSSSANCVLKYLEDCGRVCESPNDCQKKCIELWRCEWSGGDPSEPECIEISCDWASDHEHLGTGWYVESVGPPCVMYLERLAGDWDDICLNSDDCISCEEVETPPDPPTPEEASDMCATSSIGG